MGFDEGWLSVQERLDQQREEAASNPDYNKSFKGQPTKEEKNAKRKQIIATIGEYHSMALLSSTAY